jgi:hypothetical protein
LQTTTSNALAYCSARRITRLSASGIPSSEKKSTRAAERASSPIGVSSAPPSPVVIDPTGSRSTSPTSRPRRRTRSMTTAVSATGSVFAIGATAV